jgi:DNA-binding FrmR family transcriptional regulator
MEDIDVGQKGRKTHRSEKLKRDLNQRLAKIEGQIRGISRMVDSDDYCDDILNQITAVQSAIGSVRNILLESHIKRCVLESIEKNEDAIIDELMGTLKRMLK